MSDDDLLKNRDYTIIVARSIASRSEDHPWYQEWVEAQASIIDLGKKCQEFSQNGLTLYEASGFLKKYEQTTVEQLANLLQTNNSESTNTVIQTDINLVEAIADALSHYFQRKAAGETQSKGEIIVVILDQHGIDGIGELQNLIVKATTMMEKNEELGITFIQIGDDAVTRQFLTGLDDGLTRVGAEFDMVDTKYWHEISRRSIIQFLFDAILD
jgi:hypothetical protein